MPSSDSFISELQYIKGVGPKRAELLYRSGIKSATQLLNFFPRKYVDRSNIVKLSELKPDQEVTVVGKIMAAGVRHGRKKMFYIVLSDDTGFLEGVWFQSAEYFKKIFQVGDWVSLSGKVGFYRGYQLVHPDYDRLEKGEIDNLLNTGRIIPFYPGNESWKKAGLNSNFFRKVYHSYLPSKKSMLGEILPRDIIARQSFPERFNSYRQIHIPDDPEQLQRSIRRFKYEDFFYHQLLFALQHAHNATSRTGIAFVKKSERLESLYKSLPFELTNAQKKVIKEIRLDMKKNYPMNRLLQGDVGSGKTLVAIMAMLIAVDNGYQTALMVPTEILAEQHFANIRKMVSGLDVRIYLLTGSTISKDRIAIRSELESGQPLLAIGTHALIQEKIQFGNLGLVVIDEQHRFGVMQRGKLLDKGTVPDTLVMTATPIPRTLAMTAYGSLDVSVIDELPPNRKKITTLWRFENKAGQIYNFIKEKIQQGQQAFIVYPLVEESEKMDLKAATDDYEKLSKTIFKDYQVGLLHGRMKQEQKEEVMGLFVSNKIHILISTTVIEVGVDIPNATIMLIEHAERFGLSQLHQMRGRVGRGELPSYCILKTPYNIGEIAQQRMKIMTDTQDGFMIAEQDLKLRGWGDFFGTRQSGMPDFRIANPISDREILEQARNDAFELVQKDPFLRAPENSALHDYVKTEMKDKLKFYQIS